jgi:CBS domain-containing protein
MTGAVTFFRGLTAGDVVRRATLVLPQEMRVERAAQLLVKRRLNAALVADSSGRCVGVLTVVEILKWNLEEHRPGPNYIEPTACVWSDWQVVDVKPTRRDDVAHCMMRNPLLVTSDTLLEEIAEIFLGSRSRPVVMIDDARRPLGVITSKDVLAALVSVPHEDEEDSAHWRSGGHSYSAATVGSDIEQNLVQIVR